MAEHPLSAEAAFDLGLRALDAQDEGPAIDALTGVLRRYPAHAQLWQLLALLHREQDDLAPAIRAFDEAAALAPADPRIAHGRARAYLEAGIATPALFERALALSPADDSIVLGWVAALVAAGDATRAAALLEDRLRNKPGWAEGHGRLAKLQWMAGDQAVATSSLVRALDLRPTDLLLWREYLGILTHAALWDEGLAAIAAGRAAAGPHIIFDAQEAACLDEAGRPEAAAPIYARLMPIGDLALGVYYTRHLIRLGRPEDASAFAESRLAGPAANAFWPYLSIAWRLTDDPRWQWLEGDPGLVGIYDIGDEIGSLDTLAQCLRKLHVLGNQPLEQSVRGGTQTDGHLLARIDPEIRRLRAAIVSAVEDHIARLPPADQTHPALSARRDRAVRFSGSWSVRLSGGGHHANHVHPAGWLSSALYIGLPEKDDLGPPPAGWLSVGEPQAGLGLGLEPYRRIEPRPGRLVLFPSTMWHGTVPFEGGERLTVAFDVAKPV